MKTAAEIINNWQAEQYNDWYAVDSLSWEYGEKAPTVRRLFVGNREDASRIAGEYAQGTNLVDYDGNPCEPGEFGAAPFYRMTMIKPEIAHDYLYACAEHLEVGNRMLTMAEAAAKSGIAKQAIHSRIQRGRIAAEEICGTLCILEATLALWSPMK